MNCQQFRQYCTVDPTYRQDDFLHHQQVCAACAAFAKDIRWFEQVLVEAVKIEVPTDLTQHILQQQRGTPIFKRILPFVPTFFSKGNSLTPYYMLATSLLLVISLFTGGLWWQTKTSALPQEVIAYLHNEPQAFIAGDKKVPADELRGMFQAIGAKLTDEIGTVSFCKLLTLQNHPSAHIVLTGTKGPINVVFIRDSRLKDSQSLNHEKFRGMILPATWGNIAIVGASEEPLDAIVVRLEQSVKWL